MSSSPQARGRRSILVWCLALCAAMIVAGLVIHRFDPGWAGTLAIMLAGTGGAYMTGNIIPIDGGFTL